MKNISRNEKHLVLYVHSMSDSENQMTERSKKIHVFNKSVPIAEVATNNLMEKLDKPVV